MNIRDLLFPSVGKRSFSDLESALSCGIIPTHVTESEWNELFKRYGKEHHIDYLYAKFYRGAFIGTHNNENVYEFIKE